MLVHKCVINSRSNIYRIYISLLGQYLLFLSLIKEALWAKYERGEDCDVIFQKIHILY